MGEAFYKAQEATKTCIPLSGTVLLSVSDRDKPELVELARGFYECGFHIMATAGCYALIAEAGIPAEKVYKLQEGRPNILDKITNGEIDLIINTPVGKQSATDDSYIRKAAIKNRTSYMTTMAAAQATVEGIKAVKKSEKLGVKSLQEFHQEITDK